MSRHNECLKCFITFIVISLVICDIQYKVYSVQPISHQTPLDTLYISQITNDNESNETL